MSGDKLFARVGQRCEPGTILFRDGDPGDTMYVIQTGKVRIFTEVRGEQKTLAVLGPGEFFGEMAILNNKPRTASAEVVEDARLLVIDGKTFAAMIVDRTEIAVRLIQKLARRLDNANQLIDILMHRDPKARVILGLSREAEVNGTELEDGSVLVPMDQHTLAGHVGLSDAEVGSVVARMSRLGLIHEAPQGFRIPDRMRLHEFLEFLRMREEFGEN